MKKETQKTIDRLSIVPGDTLTIYQKGYSPFTGVVIAKRGGNSPSATFTIFAVLSGVSVEKIYPLHSPLITKIEKIKTTKVRRAKLYFLRKKLARGIKMKVKKEKK